MRPLASLLLVGSLAACGTRTGLGVDGPDASPAPDVPPREDAPRPVDLGAPSDVTPAACTWTSTPPVALTPGDRDRGPQAVRVLDDRLWVGFQSSNPDPPGNEAWFVRVTDALGVPAAPAVEVLPSPGEFTSYGPMSLWTSPGGRLHAAMSWTAGLGCRAVGLDDGARPIGAPVRVDRAPARSDDIACSSVLRHAAGWTFLSRGSSTDAVSNRFHAVTADGGEVVTSVLAPSQRGAAPARFVYDDGGFLFAWVAASPGARPSVVLGRHDLQGRLMSATTMVPAVRADASVGSIRFAQDGATMLVAWSESTTGSGTEVVVARTDLDGAVRVAPVTVARGPLVAGRPAEFGLAVAQGTPGVAWNPSSSGDEGGLRLTTLDPATLRPRGTADVATARFPRSVFLRGTSRGFVAVFGAIAPPTLTQVWTAPFRCVVPG